MTQTDQNKTSSPLAPEQQGPKIHLQNVELYRGTKKTLDVSDLEFPESSFTAIVGLSGSGKTTLLETLAGVLRPQKGTINVDEKPLEEQYQSHQSNLAYVAQEFTLHEELTVQNSVDHASILRSGESKQNRVSQNEILEQLNIEDLRHRRIGQLSGGQKKRVSLANEMVSTPRLLLLDEPGAELDTANKKELIRLLRKFSDEGCTVIITTHDTHHLDLFDHLVLVNRGSVEDQGSPEEILSSNDCSSYEELFSEFLSSTPKRQAPSSWWDSLLFPLYPLYLVIQGLLFWSYILIRDFVKLLYRSVKALITQPLRSMYFFARHIVPRVFCLLRREGTVIFRHRAFLTYLMFLPLILGILIGVVGEVNGQPSLTLFLSLVAAFWLGTNCSSLVIVREIRIMKHERLMSPFKETYVIAYLLAKLLWYGLIGLLVGLILVGGIHLSGSFQFSPFLRETRFWFSVGIIEFTMITGVIIGLFISAVSENQVFAMALIPLLILPGLLLSKVTLNRTIYEPVGTPEVQEKSLDNNEQSPGDISTAPSENLLQTTWYWLYRIHPLSFLYESTPLTLRPSPTDAREKINAYVQSHLLPSLIPVLILSFLHFFLTHLLLLFRGQIGFDW